MKKENPVKERNLVVSEGLSKRRSGKMLSSITKMEDSKAPIVDDGEEARPICRAFEYCKENCTNLCKYTVESD